MKAINPVEKSSKPHLQTQRPTTHNSSLGIELLYKKLQESLTRTGNINHPETKEVEKSFMMTLNIDQMRSYLDLKSAMYSSQTITDDSWPYPITIRGFAPFKHFGFGYHGDNRGYSTGNVSARVHQVINFDTDKTSITTNAWSSPTWKTSDPGTKKTATPSVRFTRDSVINSKGDNTTFDFGSHVGAANPLTPPGTPEIDIFSNFSITENEKAGTLSVSGSLRGDNFPSTEAFITDSSGNNLFIGVGQIAAGVDKDWGPFTELPLKNERPITRFNFVITTDKKGNFTGVKEGKTTYSIKDWNKRFISQPTQKQK